MPAADGLAVGVRLDPRSRRRELPAGPGRHDRARRPALPARHDDHGDDVGHAQRLGHRARRAPDRALASRDGALAHAPPLAVGLRRGARASAHAALRQRQRRDLDGVQPGVRLRLVAAVLGIHDRRLSPGHRVAPRSRAAAQAHDRHAAGLRGPSRAGAHDDARRRLLVRGAVLVRARRPRDLRGRLQAARFHRGLLARVAVARRIPGPSVARLPAAQRADAQGPELLAHGRDDRRRHDVAARDARGRAQLGLPLLVDPRLHVHALGAVHARLRLGGQRLLLLHRRCRRAPGRRRPPDHVRHPG